MVNLTEQLATLNKTRLKPGSQDGYIHWEAEYLEVIIETVKKDLSQQDWIKNWDYQTYLQLKDRGPGQWDSLFEFLSERATESQFRWFLHHEVDGEAGFDDLVALAQVGMPPKAKLEMASNYWDEMGQGDPAGTHSGLLHGVAAHFNLPLAGIPICFEANRLANVMVAMALDRKYAWMLVGALGVIEMTAPGRVGKVNEGLKRLEVPKNVRQYFSLHAALDIKHSREWNENVMEPLGPSEMRQAFLGAYLRLWLGKKCFEYYRTEIERV